MINIIRSLLDLKLYNAKQYVFMISGGVDSIAASHYFFKKTKDKSKNILFHCNHNIRKQNYEMQQTVYNFVNSLNIGSLYCYVCPEKGNKSEEECREIRFQAIDALFKNSIIITAHHLDDCTESYLLNCFRGKENYLPIPFITQTKHNIVVHPFLLSTKKDFIEYADRNNLSQFVVEDESNHITKGSRRNMIRNKIIPVLEQEQVGLRTIVRKKIESRLINNKQRGRWCNGSTGDFDSLSSGSNPGRPALYT